MCKNVCILHTVVLGCGFFFRSLATFFIFILILSLCVVFIFFCVFSFSVFRCVIFDDNDIHDTAKRVCIPKASGLTDANVYNCMLYMYLST